MDDSDSQKNKPIKRKKAEVGILQRYLSSTRHVLSAVWIRFAFQNNNGFERFILESQCGFLLYFRVFLVILYIAYETIK